MLADYLDYPMAAWEQYGGRGVSSMWGTVLTSSDNTEKGNVRVRVRLMKDRQDTFDNVPVLTGYGGSDHGACFLPEEGDIVLLIFPGGDNRHPVVAGCRFPVGSSLVEDMCQQDNPGKGLRAKNGSSVIFSGEKGRECIEVSGSESMRWRLEEEKQRITLGDREEKNQLLLDKSSGEAQLTAQSCLRLECGKSSLELKKDGTVILQCEKLQLEAGTVQLQGKAKVQIKGQELTLEGTTGVTVTGKAQIKVDSKGALKLSGAMIHLN